MYFNVKTVLSKIKSGNGKRQVWWLIGENGHLVFSAVYRIRYEYIADVTNERIISENEKVFYFIFVTFK